MGVTHGPGVLGGCWALVLLPVPLELYQYPPAVLELPVPATPQHPAAATSCHGHVAPARAALAKGLLSPGPSGQVMEVLAGRAARPGITAGRKRRV